MFRGSLRSNYFSLFFKLLFYSVIFSMISRSFFISNVFSFSTLLKLWVCSSFLSLSIYTSFSLMIPSFIYIYMVILSRFLVVLRASIRSHFLEFRFCQLDNKCNHLLIQHNYLSDLWGRLFHLDLTFILDLNELKWVCLLTNLYFRLVEWSFLSFVISCKEDFYSFS